MWPWEHLAVGYLLYSLGGRACGLGRPSGAGVLALAVGTQLPDLLDKPLSWGLGWFPTGFAVGHSVFVALPVGLATLWLARRRGHPRVGAGFVVGYWSHLGADVLNPLRTGGQPAPARVLWPISTQVPYATDRGLGRGLLYLDRLLADLSAAGSTSVVVLYLLLPGATLLLWLADGRPGVGVVWRAVDHARRLAC